MTKLILVHGYNHDPKTVKHDPGRAPGTLSESDPGGQFPQWEVMMSNRECVRFPWYSAIQGRLADIWKAWRAGHRTTYGWAYDDLALDAAYTLHEKIRRIGGPVDILCHSLGARVALQAVSIAPHRFRRVLIMNGAETVEEAAPVFEMASHVDFLSVGAYSDDVVRLAGGIFAPKIGYDPCLANGFENTFDNVQQVILDDPDEQQFYWAKYGWRIEGDNPDNYGDHSYSFLHKGNWPLLREFFS